MWWWSDNERHEQSEEHQRLLVQQQGYRSPSKSLHCGTDNAAAEVQSNHLLQEEDDKEEVEVPVEHPSLHDVVRMKDSNTDTATINDITTTTVAQQHQSPTSAPLLPFFHMVALLSTAFAYGCIFTTLFVITLPIECERIQQQQSQHVDDDTAKLSTSVGLLLSKSTLLGIFVAIAGLTQLMVQLTPHASSLGNFI